MTTLTKILVAFVVLFLATTVYPQSGSLKLSEIRVTSLPPSPSIEYIEISGVAGTSVENAAIVVIGKHPFLNFYGYVNTIIPLNGVIPADRAYLVVTSLSVTLDLSSPELLFEFSLADAQNHSFFLVENTNNLYVGQNLDYDNDGVLDFFPWETTLDSVALVNFSYIPTFCLPEVTNASQGFAIFAMRNCLDTNEWSVMSPTYPASPESPGDLNSPCLGFVCFGDLDWSGDIGSGDMSIILGSWGEYDGEADLDRNGVVGASDLATLLSMWGPCIN